MDADEFEARQRSREYFHGVRVLPGAWTVLRLDGRSFSRFTERHFEKPFDPRFSTLMTDTARTLLTDLAGPLRHDSRPAAEANRALDGASTSDKNELLFGYGINFAELPAWQRRGVGLWWENQPHRGHDPVRDVEVTSTRRRIRSNASCR